MKKQFLLTIVAMVIFSSWSCKKLLNIDPQTGQLTDADFFNDKADFDAYTFGAYSELAGNFDGNGVSAVILTQAYVSQDFVGSDEKPKDLSAYLNPSTSYILACWSQFYKVVSKANLILEKLPDAPLSNEEKTVVEGENKFLRGFAYFNLARAYGNVPLVLKSFKIDQSNEFVNAECTPETEVWDQVILDLKDAAQKLPKKAGWDAANVGRATKGAALAYLANAYMYKNDWENAEKACTELIALGEYQLLPNVRSVFSMSNPNNAESIFEIQYRDVNDGNIVWSGQPNTGSPLNEWSSPRNIGSEYAAAGGWGETIGTKTLANSFDPSDDRRKQLIKLPGEKYKGETMADTLHIPMNIAQPNSAFSTKFWFGPQPNTGVTYLHGMNVPYMRYAEFLLNYAEILFEKGKSNEAYAQVNLVRKRALLSPRTATSNKDAFMNDLMNERRWELNFEPNIWFHYTRTGTAAKFLQTEHGITMNAAWNKYPIPQTERDQNPNLCQNPGY